MCEIDKWGHAHSRLAGQSAPLIVKAAASGAGLDPRQFAGHSLRSGFISVAYTAGASATDVAKVSGHKSLDVQRRGIFAVPREHTKNQEKRVAAAARFQEVMNHWNVAMERWYHPYFCGQDDCVFLPGANTHGPAAQMSELLYRP